MTTNNSQCPLKWKKYELLANLGLTSREYIENAIKRFCKSNIELLIREVEEYFHKFKQVKNLIVIKLVEENKPGQLYNIRLEEMIDKSSLRKEILDNSCPGVVEYWYCASQVSKSLNNFSGRYLFDKSSNGIEVIEIVWWTSPRILESNINNGEFPFARFERKFPETKFRIRCTPLDRFGIDLDKTALVLKSINSFLYRHKRNIEYLKSIFIQNNISSFSLEFKFENGKGRFIDWDTCDDLHVLEIFEI